MRRWWIVFLGAAFVVGCKTAGSGGSVYGSGPITLSPRAAAGFQAYKNAGLPVAFAVSVDGRTYGYVYCTGSPCRITRSSQAAIQNCQQSSGGTPCKVFALRREIKWDGEVSGLGGGGSGGKVSAAAAESYDRTFGRWQVKCVPEKPRNECRIWQRLSFTTATRTVDAYLFLRSYGARRHKIWLWTQDPDGLGILSGQAVILTTADGQTFASNWPKKDFARFGPAKGFPKEDRIFDSLSMPGTAKLTIQYRFGTTEVELPMDGFGDAYRYSLGRITTG